MAKVKCRWQAYYLRAMSPRRWHRGSGLYRLTEAVSVNAGGFLTSTEYVIVAVSPLAVDHGQPETTIYAANRDGSLFGDFTDRDADDPEDHTYVERLDMDSAEFEHCRIVGRYDPGAALEKLGYRMMGTVALPKPSDADPRQLAALRAKHESWNLPASVPDWMQDED